MNQIWYISPSNQAGNMGVGDYGSERDQMYSLALSITPHLDRAGVSFVVPERDTSLAQRVRHSNELGCAFHLALHSNAGGRGQARGPVALYYSESGRAFAEKLVNSLLELGQETNRSYHTKEEKSLYELRKTAAPAVLLEVDFHDSPGGVEFITRYRGRIAEAIARCIIEADGKAFVPPAPWERVVKLGLLESDTLWEEPVRYRELAAMTAKLVELMEAMVK